MKKIYSLILMALPLMFLACEPVNRCFVIPAPERLTEGRGTYSLSRGDVKYIVDSSLAEDQYVLKVTRQKAEARSGGEEGLRYAARTVEQITTEDSRSLLCCTVEDRPRFKYRGLLLDCARHFYTKDEIKKVLDIMAFYKLNRFHWHLTDDHGWRIEIKRYPRLVEVGAFGDIGSRSEFDPNLIGEIRYEGYYSQDDIREIVEYADSLGITIIPEIDMPGHMTSALAAYPELGCTGGPYKVINVVGPRGKGLGKENLCVGSEEVFSFVEGVLKEVTELFPSEYIHLGGDECLPDRWMSCPKCMKRLTDEGLLTDTTAFPGKVLQGYFTLRVQKILESLGRKMIGWDEILDGSIDAGAVIMSWRGMEGGRLAARRGFDVIMSPTQSCYLDKRQSDDVEHEPIAMSGTLTVKDVYIFDPLEGLSEAEAPHIIGVQGNLWCDVISTNEYLEYMLLPRLAALSEVQWCSRENKDWVRFRECLDAHAKYYEKHGYVYARHLWGIVGLPGHTHSFQTDDL